MYRIISEWDIGESDLLFTGVNQAKRWIRNNIYVHDMAGENEQTVDEFIRDCYSGGLLGFKLMEIVE